LAQKTGLPEYYSPGRVKSGSCRGRVSALGDLETWTIAAGAKMIAEANTAVCVVTFPKTLLNEPDGLATARPRFILVYPIYAPFIKERQDLYNQFVERTV
jgi:hypothetical protein